MFMRSNFADFCSFSFTTKLFPSCQIAFIVFGLGFSSVITERVTNSKVIDGHERNHGTIVKINVDKGMVSFLFVLQMYNAACISKHTL